MGDAFPVCIVCLCVRDSQGDLSSSVWWEVLDLGWPLQQQPSKPPLAPHSCEE